MQELAVHDERLAEAIAGGNPPDSSFWEQTLAYLAEIAGSVANHVKLMEQKALRVIVTNDSINVTTSAPMSVKLDPGSSVTLDTSKPISVVSKVALPVDIKTSPRLTVAIDDFTGPLTKLVKRSEPMIKTCVCEVDYWKNVYGIGGGDLRQALPVAIVDSTRSSSKWSHSLAAKTYTSGLEGIPSSDSDDDFEKAGSSGS